MYAVTKIGLMQNMTRELSKVLHDFNSPVASDKYNIKCFLRYGMDLI
jgi:hypothetical protein